MNKFQYSNESGHVFPCFKYINQFSNIVETYSDKMYYPAGIVKMPKRTCIFNYEYISEP